MSKVRLLAALAVFALLAAGCGDDDGGAADSTTTVDDDLGDTDDGDTDDGDTDDGGDDLGGDDLGDTDDGGDDLGGDGAGADDGTDGDDGGAEDPCAGVTLEATDTGVTADTITVVVMADVGSELAPGLFQGSIDGVLAWAEKVNDTGGLACRRVEVVEWDSAINPTETTNGFLEACDQALAMVGSNSLFVTDVTELETCQDASGAPIGIPDFSALAVENAHQCSPNNFAIGRPTGTCPYGGGVRQFTSSTGPYRWLMENVVAADTAPGVFLVPADLPSTTVAGVAIARSVNSVGVDTAGREFGISGSDEQATYGAYVQAMRQSGATFVMSSSNDQAMLKWRKEAVAQGFDLDTATWVCTTACYTPDFIEQGGADVDGVYFALQQLPYEEADTNDELATFLEYYGEARPPSWAAGAWAAGVLFEQVVSEIVADAGPNGVTRAAVLERARGVTDFDANGWYAPIDLTENAGGPACWLMMQVVDGAFVRVHPEEPGTFDCDPADVVTLEFDPAAEFQG